MGLGDSLNSLAGGYVRGQAQYAANEKTRQEQAQAAAKAAQDAAEFRLKLAQHSQTLTNSAEAEWGAIFDPITSDEWDPGYIAKVLPRAANFDKTYGAVWGGGSAVKNLQDALHLNTVKADGALEKGQVGPQVEQAQVPNELFGYLSPEQKAAADEKAISMRSAEAGRKIYAMASEYIGNADGGLVDEVTAYTRLHDLQAKLMGSGEFDPKVIDDAFDHVRDNIAKAYLGVANQMGLGDKARERIEETGRQASTWITSLLQMDANGAMIGEDLFASRTPLRMKMEQYAQDMAAQGMALGQIKVRMATRFSDELGGLELDITKTPGMGALTFAGAPTEARQAVDRYFDLNMSPNEHRLETYWNPQTNEAWVVDPMDLGSSQRVWPPAQQNGVPQGVAGNGSATTPGTSTPPVQPDAKKERPRDKYGVVIQSKESLVDLPAISAEITEAIGKWSDKRKATGSVIDALREGRIDANKAKEMLEYINGSQK